MVQKWNFKTRKYKDYEVPSGWYISCYENDMEAAINCAECGNRMTFGEGYTSRTIHTEHGFGYSVCPKCYEAEWQAEKAARKQPQEVDG